MSFNTLEFAVFIALFFIGYWFVFAKHLRLQNIWVLIASYVFYGSWDWRFLFLIFASSATDYCIGLAMGRTEDTRYRKWLLWLSLAVNLGILAYFKYFNFFLDNVNQASTLFGLPLDWPTRNIILPVGISFYTLQTLSYTFDVYKRKLEPIKDAVVFFAYVSFFPQLVAGPIERATHLLPQFMKPRRFDYTAAADGARQILWGLFMKMVVADNIGPFVDDTFLHANSAGFISLLIATVLAYFQIYCDFAGYSNIAIGAARIFGFDLMKNFDYPLFSRNMSEFWQKWHISLITWFRDYVIYWLNGRTKNKVFRNIVVIFLITGLWHGADWRYLIWGALNACLFIPLIYGKRKKYRKPVGYQRALPTWSEFVAMSWVFIQFLTIGIWFRSFNFQNAVDIYYNICTLNRPFKVLLPDAPVLFVFLLVAVEWWQRDKDHGLDIGSRQLSAPARWSMYAVLIFVTLFYGGQPNEFIYFQF